MAKPASMIETWEDWPDDVRSTLRAWNHASCQILRFPYTRGFICADCYEEYAPNRYGDAVLDGRNLCDGCLIDVCRDFLVLDRSEQEALIKGEGRRMAEWIDDRLWVIGAMPHQPWMAIGEQQ